MRTLRHSLAFAFADRYIVAVLAFLLAIISARFLTPGEMGIVAIGLAAYALSDVCRDLGASLYLVQEPDLTPMGVRSTFTILLLSTAALSATLWLVAGPLAAWYGDRQVADYLEVAAASLLVGPFSIPAIALLRREMRFATLAGINILGASVNLCVTVGLAAHGWGPTCFAWGGLAAGAVVASAAMGCRREWQGMRPALQGWRRILGFGGYSTGAAVLYSAYQAVPNLLLGRVLGLGDLGLYSRATWLGQLSERYILSAMGPVLLPAFSNVARAGGDLKAPFLTGVRIVTAVHWPVQCCTAILAAPLVATLFGPQWGAAASLVALVAIGSTMSFVGMLTFPLLVCMGRVRDLMLCNLIALPLSGAVLVAASTWGVGAVAASQAAVSAIQMYVAVAFVRRYIPLSWKDLGAATLKSALTTASSAGLCASMAAMGTGMASPAMVVALGGTGALLGWLVGLKATGHPLAAELDAAGRSLLRAFRRRAARA